MSKRVVGLDVGTHAVRAVELVLGRAGTATVSRFGQVALPPGVVTGGEVLDPSALADAIRRLWKEVRFTSRRVVVGVSSQRVIVRPTVLPAMGRADLESAIDLQAAELIPMPLDEVILDHQILDRTTDDSGEDELHVLLVAAQKGIVRNLVAAVELAGLSASLVDLTPFALLRSLVDVTAFDDLVDDRPAAEALVSIGGGVTTVVVHERGVPRFVRMVMRGGATFTEEIAEGLSLGFEAAEGLKRQVSAGLLDGPAGEAAVILEGLVEDFADELNTSLDYHRTQDGAAPISRIVLTGGAARTGGLVDALARRTGIDVVLGAPFAQLELARTGLTDAQIGEAEDLAAVAVGLALAGRPVERGARRLSLLPAEVTQRSRTRQQILIGAAACLAVVVGLMLLWLQRGGQIEDAEALVAARRADVAALEQDIAALTYLREVEGTYDGRVDLVTRALAGDVAWPRVLQELATVLPDVVWLESFSGAAGADGERATIEVRGRGSNHTSSARWLIRVGALESTAGLWVPTSSLSIDAEDLPTVEFDSDAFLTDRATSDRLDRYLNRNLVGAPEPVETAS